MGVRASLELEHCQYPRSPFLTWRYGPKPKLRHSCLILVKQLGLASGTTPRCLLPADCDDKVHVITLVGLAS